MKWFRENWQGLIGFALIAVLGLYGIWRSHQVNAYPRYTIGVTTRRLLSAKGGWEIEYFYLVNGEKYVSYGYDVEKYNIRYPNGRYFVKFSYKNPSACEILWGDMVPDSIVSSPIEGWENLPSELSENSN